MLGKNSGVIKQLIDECEKALPSYYLGHSTSLSMCLVYNVSYRMKDYMDACMEIIKLIKFSSKWETILENMKMANIIVAKS